MLFRLGYAQRLKTLKKSARSENLKPSLMSEDLAEAQLFAGISRATIIAVVRLGSGVGPGSGVCPRSGVEKERGVGVTAVIIETMQEERLALNAIRKNAVPVVA